LAIKVALMGLGAIGRGIARCALQKHDLEIVAAIDLDPHRVGRKLSDVVDAPTPEVVIGSDAGAEMRKAQGGILLHATGSRLDRIEGELAQALTAVSASFPPAKSFPIPGCGIRRSPSDSTGSRRSASSRCWAPG